MRIIGGLGFVCSTGWTRYALPEEARMAEPTYARVIAAEFVHALAAHGTTTALVFGSHFAAATAALFEAADRAACASSAGWCFPTACCARSCIRRPSDAYRESTRSDPRDFTARGDCSTQ